MCYNALFGRGIGEPDCAFIISVAGVVGEFDCVGVVPVFFRAELTGIEVFSWGGS